MPPPNSGYPVPPNDGQPGVTGPYQPQPGYYPPPDGAQFRYG